MVDKAEQLLLDMGFHQVRVRIHGMMARIEIDPSEFGKLMEEENREKIAKTLKAYGFTYVTLDLMGYRTGSMNETLLAYSTHINIEEINTYTDLRTIKSPDNGENFPVSGLRFCER